MDIIFATTNPGKLKEAAAIMADSGYRLLSLQDAGVHMDVEENGVTFADNAMIKAVAIMEASGCPALADDSGLEIDFLDKKPGVHSARYMGEDTPYTVKNEHILSLMKEVPQEKRTARFVCAMALALPNGLRLQSLASLEGFVAYDALGNGGFGYDPIFYVPQQNLTLGQMSPEMKNALSHRKLALEAMKREMKARHEAFGIQ